MNRRYRLNSGPRRQQRGVGLIEVLIAVVVLAIGLLGLAGLQIRTLRDNEGASERAVAIMQTHSILDAMRADRQNAVNGLFNVGFTTADPSGSTFREKAIRAWRANLTAVLGSTAKGKIACNGADCTITVQWTDPRRVVGDQTSSLATEVQL